MGKRKLSKICSPLKLRKKVEAWAVMLLLLLLASGCRQDDLVIMPDEQTTDDAQVSDQYLGLYVLNEGNMGSNKATLDYLDFSTGAYSRNIYPSRNPNVVKELGDVGNDVKIHNGELWMVINLSNKVEVADAMTAVSRGRVEIPNCRYLAFQGDYAYVSSYVGKIYEQSVLGAVYKIDVKTLKVVDTCVVGYQPEEMVIQDGRLYVANSGGYNPMFGMEYDRTVSVIDLVSFKEIRKIDVGVNLFRLRADKYGKLWVTSRGDYANRRPMTFIVDNDEVIDSLNLPIGDMAFRGDSLVYYAAVFGEPKAEYGVLDIRTHKVINSDFIAQPTDNPITTPYGIMVHPLTGNVYLMDATNYVSSGKLYCFDQNGKFKWVTWTGDIPGHGCFLKK